MAYIYLDRRRLCRHFCKHKALLYFALIVLDLGWPDIDGLELMSRLRHLKTPLPILILIAQDGVNDWINGIEQGADDYMTKPFVPQELNVRINA